MLNVWPNIVGEFSANAGAVQFPFEAHGLRLGLKPATVKLEKHDRDGVLSSLGTLSVALDPSTLVVPINIVVVRPTEAVSADIRANMAAFLNVAYYQALFDDLWTPNLTRSTGPLGVLNQIGGTWTTRTTKTTATNGMVLSTPRSSLLEAYPRPDDIFAQCGIQFRLTSVMAIDEPEPRNVFMTTNGLPSGDVLCAGGAEITLKGIFSTWRERAKTSPAEVRYGAFNDGAITVIFSHLINHQSCFIQASGLTNSENRTVTLGVGNSGGAAPQFILSHEMGHALGMNHPPAPCSNDIMCASSGDWTPHIPGCETRDGATLDPVPYNCIPAPMESAPTEANCSLARTNAASAVAKAANPVPMDPPAGGTGGPGSNTQGWQGPGTPISSYDPSIFTEGTASLVVGGDGYRTITSRPFRTADWLQVGDKFALDVFVSPGQPHPNWFGSVDLFFNVPAAGIYNAALGHAELTPLGVGSWRTIEFTLSDPARMALLGDYPQGSLTIAINTPVGAPAIHLDNLRAAGNLADRTVFHDGPAAGGVSNALFSFDSQTDWNVSNGTLRHEPELVTMGVGSLGVTSGGYTEIYSRPFATSELGIVTSTLSIDILVPAQQPNPYWIGSLQAFVSCPTANVYNAYLGQQDLTYLFREEFNTVTFPTLSSQVTTALSGGGSCILKLALNTPIGAGEYLLDNLAFR